jgi:catechol 2,3-dioxygenase-like lactoylglutathione lyase family enzyme
MRLGDVSSSGGPVLSQQRPRQMLMGARSHRRLSAESACYPLSGPTVPDTSLQHVVRVFQREDPAVQPKLDHCVIHISDWEQSNAFYRDVLGAELIDRGDGTWAYRFGTEQLNVHGPGVNPEPVARIPVAPGNSDLCFEWPSPIETAAQHLDHRGVTVEEGPVARDGAKGSGLSVYFRDPDGSLLEFISYTDR